MKKFLPVVCILVSMSCAYAEDVFNSSTKVLSIPAVTIDQTTYSDVQLRLDSFSVVSVGGSSAVAKPCTAANFTATKVNAIDIGMTVGQVSQIIGCDNNDIHGSQFGYSLIYSWSYQSYAPQYTSALILVLFDGSGEKVSPLAGTTVIKMSSGF